jgi:LacI family transcriptional regulator
MPSRSKNLPTSAAPHVALLVETSLASGREILRGVARYVREHGPWSLFHAPRGLEETAPSWLASWKGDGIIARITTPALAEFIKKINVPVIDVLGLVPESGFPLIHVDDPEIARQAFAHLAERGFRDFAFFGLAGENWSERRREAFMAEARRFSTKDYVLEMTRKEIEETPWETRQDQLGDWLSQLPKPCGLMVCSDQRGPDVLEACRRVGIKVPDEIAIVGVDNDEPLCEVCNPPLSSVWPNHLGVGYEAAAMLHKLMQGESLPAMAQFVAPRGVVTRQSSDVLALGDPLVAAALRLIREEACSGISVDDVTQRVGASRSVLQRRFSAMLGQTIHDRLVGQRIKAAIGVTVRRNCRTLWFPPPGIHGRGPARTERTNPSAIPQGRHAANRWTHAFLRS